MCRKYVILLSVLIAVLCQSCLTSSEDYTPVIQCSEFNYQDTILSPRYDYDNDIYLADTMAVGDTVRFAIAFATFSNNLVSVSAEWDKKSIEHIAHINDTIQSVLDMEQSDIEQCYLKFPVGYNGVVFPVTVVALREGATDLIYTVRSDSKFAEAQMKFRFYVD